MSKGGLNKRNKGESQVDNWWKNIPGRRTAQCECPEVDKAHLESLKEEQGGSAAGKIQAEMRMIKDEV